MDLERERIVEAVVAVAVTALMFGAMFVIGSNYGGEDGGLSATGGEMLVYAIIGFIVLLTVLGVGLAYTLNEPESEETNAADADDQNDGSAA